MTGNICGEMTLNIYLRHVVTPDMVRDTRWFKSPYVGVVSFRVLNIIELKGL